ncbi:MAG: hypothetical protein F6J99_29950 [Moorea sp. SIO4G3]|nr:hypothetical protein [Moorena sp. SIO4G3]
MQRGLGGSHGAGERCSAVLGVSPTRALHQDRCGRRFRTQTHAPLAIAVVSPTRALHQDNK